MALRRGGFGIRALGRLGIGIDDIDSLDLFAKLSEEKGKLMPSYV